MRLPPLMTPELVQNWTKPEFIEMNFSIWRPVRFDAGKYYIKTNKRNQCLQIYVNWLVSEIQVSPRTETRKLHSDLAWHLSSVWHKVRRNGRLVWGRCTLVLTPGYARNVRPPSDLFAQPPRRITSVFHRLTAHWTRLEMCFIKEYHQMDRI